MPRTLQQILDQADQLSTLFELHDPSRSEIHEAAALRGLRAAFKARAQADAHLSEAVSLARTEGHSWATVGAMLGTSGEAARQRYGHTAHRH